MLKAGMLAAIGVTALASATSALGAVRGGATIATATSGDVRAVLTAVSNGGGSAPTARVTLTTYTRSGATWRKTATKPVAGTYFWKVVSAPRALCRLDLSTAAGRGSSPHVVVQLLVTPSLGCGAAQTMRLPSG